MQSYNAKQDLEENLEAYTECYEANIEYINENGGESLSDKEKHILIAGFLSNMHDTLSNVSSNLCQLSKSGYDASVYINEIREYQQRINEEYIRDDIEMFLKYKDRTDAEKLELIKEYVSKLGD